MYKINDIIACKTFYVYRPCEYQYMFAIVEKVTPKKYKIRVFKNDIVDKEYVKISPTSTYNGWLYTTVKPDMNVLLNTMYINHEDKTWCAKESYTLYHELYDPEKVYKNNCSLLD